MKNVIVEYKTPLTKINSTQVEFLGTWYNLPPLYNYLTINPCGAVLAWKYPIKAGVNGFTNRIEGCKEIPLLLATTYTEKLQIMKDVSPLLIVKDKTTISYREDTTILLFVDCVFEVNSSDLIAFKEIFITVNNDGSTFVHNTHPNYINGVWHSKGKILYLGLVVYDNFNPCNCLHYQEY